MSENPVRAIHALQGHVDKVWSVAFSPDGRTLVSGAEDRTIIAWDTTTYQERFSCTGHFSGVNTVAISPDGETVASGGEDSTIRLWPRGQRDAWVQRLPRGGVNQVAFSPDGRLIAAVGGLNGQAGHVRIWHVGSGCEVGNFTGHRDEVMTVEFSPTGRWLLTGDFGGTLKIWDVPGDRERLSIDAHLGTVWKGGFFQDDDVLISAGEDGRFRFWFAPTGRMLSQLPGDTFGMLSFALSGDSRVAVGRYDGELSLWDLGGSRRGRTLGNHGGAIFCVAFSPDGHQIATAGTDRLVRLWDLQGQTPRGRSGQDSGPDVLGLRCSEQRVVFGSR